MIKWVAHLQHRNFVWQIIVYEVQLCGGTTSRCTYSSGIVLIQLKCYLLSILRWWNAVESKNEYNWSGADSKQVKTSTDRWGSFKILYWRSAHELLLNLVRKRQQFKLIVKHIIAVIQKAVSRYGANCQRQPTFSRTWKSRKRRHSVTLLCLLGTKRWIFFHRVGRFHSFLWYCFGLCGYRRRWMSLWRLWNGTLCFSRACLPFIIFLWKWVVCLMCAVNAKITYTSWYYDNSYLWQSWSSLVLVHSYTPIKRWCWQKHKHLTLTRNKGDVGNNILL